jgi:hypothetical protein
MCINTHSLFERVCVEATSYILSAQGSYRLGSVRLASLAPVVNSSFSVIRIKLTLSSILYPLVSETC